MKKPPAFTLLRPAPFRGVGGLLNGNTNNHIN